MADGKALCVDGIVVYADRMVVRVSCVPEWRLTTPHVAKRACMLRPNLAQHACINEKGPTFSAVMDRTPLPHLFEHVVVDLLVERSHEQDATFVGTSEWTDRERGMARVEISFINDLEALAAIKDAELIVNNLTCS